MDTKLVEIRDRGTLVPALALRVSGRDGWLFQRAGFGDQPLVYLIMLATEQCQYDPYHWDNRRTMGNAHHWIAEHWEELTSGAVVDVEFILGETAQPKRSEQLSHAD